MKLGLRCFYVFLQGISVFNIHFQHQELNLLIASRYEVVVLLASSAKSYTNGLSL